MNLRTLTTQIASIASQIASQIAFTLASKDPKRPVGRPRRSISLW